jgi:uncharacterized membrane protein
MDKKRPLDNAPLTAMLFTGVALLFLGTVIWFSNADRYADEASVSGQFIGSSIGLAGLLLLVLGWTAAAICRQIADAAEQSNQS